MRLRLQSSRVAESTALSSRGGGTTTRASGECATTVIGFRERTAAELMEFVVCFSLTEGNDSHQGLMMTAPVASSPSVEVSEVNNELQ